MKTKDDKLTDAQLRSVQEELEKQTGKTFMRYCSHHKCKYNPDIFKECPACSEDRAREKLQ